MSNLKGLLIFAAGALTGAVVGIKAAQKRIQEKADEEIQSVKEMYKRKAKRMQEVAEQEKQMQEQPEVKEEKEVEQVENKKEYDNIIKTNDYVNYNKIEMEKQQEDEEDWPYTINPEDFGSDIEYDTCTMTYFADEVVVDDVDEVLSDEDIKYMIGWDNLQIFKDHDGCRAIYVRNDVWKTDYEIIRDDWKWSDIDGNQPEKTEKKPHQL